jgi:hypothetical protein
MQTREVSKDGATVYYQNGLTVIYPNILWEDESKIGEEIQTYMAGIDPYRTEEWYQQVESIQEQHSKDGVGDSNYFKPTDECEQR